MKFFMLGIVSLILVPALSSAGNGRDVDQTVLFDNGPLMTHAGAGSGGADVSAVQNVTLGLSEYGFCHWGGVNNKVSDEFVISDQQGWTIDTLCFYGFQTTNSTQSTYLALQWWIYDGDPAGGGTVLCTDSATVVNGRLITGWSGIYRTMEDDMATATNRSIMLNRCVADSPCELGPGTYWVVVQAWGTIPTCIWYPLVSIIGTPETGNARQFLGSANDWFPIMDGVYPQGIPILLKGVVGNGGSPVPCEDIFFFKAKCNTSGTAQSMVKITGDYGGETVTIGLDGESHEVTLLSNGTISVGRLAVRNAGAGEHTVNLIDPTGCYEPIVFNCQVDDSQDPVWDAEWEDAGLADLRRNPEYPVASIFPNPFNPTATIRYTVVDPGHVSVTVFDMLGREIVSLVDEYQIAGTREIVWDSRNVPSGTYFARLTTGGSTLFLRLLLVR